MAATLSTVTQITKEIYGPRIVDQLEDETVLSKRIEKTSRGTESTTGGKYVTFPLRVRRNAGLGYRNEGQQLQAAGQQGYQSVRVGLRYGYGRVQINGQVFELVHENYQAFADAMTREMDGLKDDIQKDTNRILWSNGKGVCATIDTGVTTAGAGNNVVSVGTSIDDLNFIDMGMQIDILDSTGVTPKASNRQVVALNESTGDFTFDGAAATVVVGDIVVRTGNYGLEPQGLTSIVAATGTLFNLDPASEPLWKSTEDNTGGALSESKMIALVDRVRQRGGKTSAIFTDLGSRRAYFNLLSTQRRFVDTKEFAGGLSGLVFNYGAREVPLVEDIDAPLKKMWFLDESTFCIYRTKPWHWEDKDGNTWKWVTNYDSFEAMMKQYWEFACERRNANAVMTNITPG